MAEKEYRIKETDLTAIADSIRYKHNSTSQYSVEDMPQAIRNIETIIPDGYIKPEREKNIDTNGIHDVTEYASVNVRVDARLPEQTKELIVNENGEYTIVADTGYVITEASVSVNVPDIPAVLQDKTVVPTKSQQEVVADAEYDGLGKTTVLPIPDEYLVPAGKFDISANGEYSIKEYEFVGVNIDTRLPGQEKTLNITNNGSYSIVADEGYELSKANINVSVADIPAVLQEKEITPTKNVQVILPDEEYEGFSNVTINPIPDEYIIPEGVLSIVENGSVTVSPYAEVVVNVQPELEIAEITPTKTTQVVVPVEKYGLKSVTINPIPDEYITTNDATATAEDVMLNKTFYANGERLTGLYIPYDGQDLKDEIKGILEGSYNQYATDYVENLGDYVFYNNLNLNQISLPSAKTIGCSFIGCENLHAIVLPGEEKVSINLDNNMIKNCETSFAHVATSGSFKERTSKVGQDLKGRVIYNLTMNKGEGLFISYNGTPLTRENTTFEGLYIDTEQDNGTADLYWSPTTSHLLITSQDNYTYHIMYYPSLNKVIISNRREELNIYVPENMIEIYQQDAIWSEGEITNINNYQDDYGVYNISYELNGGSWEKIIGYEDVLTQRSTVAIKKYDLTGLLQGGHYLCDESILPKNGGANSLTYQYKVCMNYDSALGAYRVDYSNIPGESVANKAWTRAICSLPSSNGGPSVPVTDLIYVGEYIKFDNGEPVEKDSNFNALVYTKTTQSIKEPISPKTTYSILDLHDILPAPLYEGKLFEGWCRNADLSDTPSRIIPVGTTGDLTLYAKFVDKN